MKNMNNSDMNIELLKAMRGVWIIQIETIEKAIRNNQHTHNDFYRLQGKLKAFEECLNDLIAIIGE